MTNLIIGHYDAITDEQITRVATDEEKKVIESEIADFEKLAIQKKEEIEAAVLAKTAAKEKLAALGLSEIEIKALGLG